MELISRPNLKIGPNSLTRSDRGRSVRYDWWAPSPVLYKNRRGAGARYPKFTAATFPSDIPIRSRERLADGKLHQCRHATSTTMTRSAAPIPGQCRWRPEGYCFPRRPSPPPDGLFSDPEFAVGVMTTPSSSAFVPPPSTGGAGLTSSSLSLIYVIDLGKDLFTCVFMSRTCARA